MNAARTIESMGASVSLVGGKLKLAGLDRLDRDTAARVLDVARAHKAEIMAELGGLVAPVPADAFHLEALARFERDPVGVIHWLGQQEQGQPEHLVERWAAAIRAEARWRLEEGELHGNA